VQGRRQVLEPVAAHVAQHEPAQPGDRDEVRPRAGHGEHPGERRDREHVAPAHLEPQRGELVDRLRREVARGDERAVDRADRRADDDVRADAVVGERAEHADLDRAEARAAGEDEGDAHIRFARRRPADLRSVG
jgi:hypothetical protein